MKVKVAGGLHEENLYVYKNGVFYLARLDVPAEQKIPRPGREIFESGTGDMMSHLFQQPQVMYAMDNDFNPDTHPGIEYPVEGGIYRHLVGKNGVKLLYPAKSFPTPEAAQANNIFKRLLIGQLRFLAKNPWSALSLLTYRGLESFLREMASCAEITLGPFYLVENRYTKACREIRRCVQIFLEEIKMPVDVCRSFAQMVATVLEYDDAYLHRVQDLANETTKEAILKNRIKELKRLVGILKQRDPRAGMFERFNSGLILFSMLLWVPKFKRAFIKVVNEMDLSKIQMDDGDKYHVLRWVGYDYLGRSFEDRWQEFSRLHNGVLPEPIMFMTKPLDKNEI